MPQHYISLWYHLVWSTKNRQPFIQKTWRRALYAHIKTFCQEKNYHLDHINGISDHVHLLVSIRPTHALSDVVRNIKVDSYYWIQEQGYCEEIFGWQDGYAAFSVSPTQLPKVRNYIRRQEQHHQEKDFSEEWESLLSLGKVEKYKEDDEDENTTP